MRRRLSKLIRGIALAALALVLLLAPALAFAGPRSGSSFGGRLGFRSPGGGMSVPSYGGGSPGYYGGGPSIHVFPGFGWGWGGYGYGGGFGFGSILTVVIIGVAVASIARALRARGGGQGWGPYAGQEDDEPDVIRGRAYVYKLQLALGRSARGIQDRLAAFAAEGDTSSEAGLAALAQQTALELLRESDAIRYASAEARGPLTLTNAETAMNGIALAERSRFQVERLRVSDGRTSRSAAPAEEGKEALELVVVTFIAATRTPLSRFDDVEGPEQLRALLSELGGISPDGLLGIEVIWTPADADDSMTETDVMTTYPELKSV